MLDIAQKYSQVLACEFFNITHDFKYMFFNDGYVETYKPEESTWGKYEFVSVLNGEVIGYISYNLDRSTYSVNGLCAINFSDNKAAFGMDLGTALRDIFEKYNFRKLTFGVFIGNPIEKTYDKMIERYGGRIVGVYRQYSRLMDGNYYDYKVYEIFKYEYVLSKYKQVN